MGRDLEWGEVARGQAGIITRDQLYEAQLSERQVSLLLIRGELERVQPRVHLVRGAPLSYDARLWAAVLSTGGVLGFHTAAHLWGMAAVAPERIDIVIDRARRLRQRPGVRLHRINVAPTHRTRRHALPITTRAETLLDHIGRLRPAAASTLTDRAFQQGWLTPADLDRRLGQAPGRTGNRLLRRLLAANSDGAAAQSERILHSILRRGGLRDFEINFDVWLDGELLAVVDVALPRSRIAIEIDGWAHHVDTERFQRDRTRANGLVLAGWMVVRFTWADITQRPNYVLRTVKDLERGAKRTA